MDAIEKAVAKSSKGNKAQKLRSATQNMASREKAVLTRKPAVNFGNKGMVASNTVFNAPGVSSKSRRRPKAKPQSRLFTLPYKELEAEGMVEATGKRNQLSEEYRAIKRPILAAMDNASELDEDHTNILMVTSSVSGEGKTFSAINLAISIAMERDRSVLLVDGDVTNPSAGRRLGFRPTQPGLTDVLLRDEVNLENVVCQSDIPNLRFLPAGSAARHVTELLSSRDMSSLLQNLSSNYEDQVIVFDSAPMLMTSEASVVADLAGQIVFVVGAETTTRGMVSDALKMINDHSRVGFVLNKTRKKQSNIYGYGYGYGTG